MASKRRSFWASLSDAERYGSTNIGRPKTIGALKCWEPQGPILRKWIEILPIILSIINNRTNNDWIFQNSPKPHVHLCELYMIGKTASLALPTVVAICREKRYAKRLVTVLQKSQIMARQDLGFSYLPCEGDRDDIRRIAGSAVDASTSTNAQSDTLCGAWIGVLDTSNTTDRYISYATLGGVIQINEQCYGLTSRRLINQRHDVQDTNGVEGLDDDEQEQLGSMFEPDEPLQHSLPIKKSPSATQQIYWLDKQHSAQARASGGETELRKESEDTLIYPLPERSEEEQRQCWLAQDWGLFPMAEPATEEQNVIKINGKDLTCRRVLTGVLPLNVTVVSAMSGTTSATCSKVPRGITIPVPYGQGATSMGMYWTLAGACSPGDSGSWVINPDNGDLCAVVVASSEAANETYCISAADIFDHLLAVHDNHTNISLLGGSKYKLSRNILLNDLAVRTGSESDQVSDSCSNSSHEDSIQENSNRTILPNTNTERTATKGNAGHVGENTKANSSRRVNQGTQTDLPSTVPNATQHTRFATGQSEKKKGKAHDEASTRYAPGNNAGRFPRDSGYDSVREVENITRPTYIRCHQRHLSPATLDVYGLPWEFDQNDPDYVIIREYIDHQFQRELFAHTASLANNRLRDSSPRWSDGGQGRGRDRSPINIVPPIEPVNSRYNKPGLGRNYDSIDLENIFGTRPSRRRSRSRSSSRSTRTTEHLEEMWEIQDANTENATDLSVAQLIESHYDQAYLLYTAQIMSLRRYGGRSNAKSMKSLWSKFYKLRNRKRQAIEAIEDLPTSRTPLKDLQGSQGINSPGSAAAEPFEDQPARRQGTQRRENRADKSATREVNFDGVHETAEDAPEWSRGLSSLTETRNPTGKLPQQNAVRHPTVEDDADDEAVEKAGDAAEDEAQDVVEVITELPSRSAVQIPLPPARVLQGPAIGARPYRDESRIDPLTGGINRLVREGKYTISLAALDHYKLGHEVDPRCPRDIIIKPWVSDRMVGELIEYTQAHKDAQIREDLYGHSGGSSTRLQERRTRSDNRAMSTYGGYNADLGRRPVSNTTPRVYRSAGRSAWMM